MVAGARSGAPMEAGWFQAFSEGESTYDADGEPQSLGWDSSGWAPGGDIPGHLGPTPVPGKWFQESQSGGGTEACLVLPRIPPPCSSLLLLYPHPFLPAAPPS